MIGLLHPEFLWALAGSGIPVAIHLLSQKEGKIIYMGSLRHLNVSFNRQFKSIRLNQLVLLILRVHLVIVLVLILCGAWWNSAPAAKKWLLFEKGTEKTAGLKSVRDSLERLGYETRSLAKGFPLLKDGASFGADNYWALSAQLGKLPLSDVIIFSWMTLEKFRGTRIAQTENQHWIAVEPTSIRFPISALAVDDDSLLVRLAHTTSRETSFASVRIKSGINVGWFKTSSGTDSVLIDRSKPVSVELLYGRSVTSDVKIIRAALMTLHQAYPHRLTFSEFNTGDKSSTRNYKADYVICLSADKEIVHDSSRLILLHENLQSSHLFERENNTYVLTRHLTPDIALSENLTIELAKIVFDSGGRNMTESKDRRMLPSPLMWTPKSPVGLSTPSVSPTGKTAEPYLLLAFMIILISERFIAWRRNQ